jgi:hypothetical protein
MNSIEAIAGINARLAQIDEVLEIGDVNHEQFEELVQIYESGVTLRAFLQSTQTLRERKNQYKKENSNDE